MIRVSATQLEWVFAISRMACTSEEAITKANFGPNSEKYCPVESGRILGNYILLNMVFR